MTDLQLSSSRQTNSTWPCTCDPAPLLASLQQALATGLHKSDSVPPVEETCSILTKNLCRPYFETLYRNVAAEVISDTSTAATDAATVHHPTAAETWGLGMLSVVVVSSCAVFGLCWYPIMQKRIFHFILTWMIGLAIGTLSSIAIFHLIPQAFEMPVDSQEDVDVYIHKALVVIISIYGFYIAERIFKIVVDHRKRKEEFSKVTFSPKVSSSVAPVQFTARSKSVPEVIVSTVEEPGIAGRRVSEETGRVTVTNANERRRQSVAEAVAAKVEMTVHKEHAHFHAHDDSAPLKSIAWLIIVGDAIVDGLSMGAAFSMSTLGGISIAIAIFCEELPHELGDLAILIRSGLSLKRAVIYNSLSSITCFVGFTAGVFLGDLPSASIWIFAVASGMFIYISFVNILPEMTATIEEASQKSLKSALTALTVQMSGVAFGVTVMYVLSRFSHAIDF